MLHREKLAHAHRFRALVDSRGWWQGAAILRWAAKRSVRKMGHDRTGNRNWLQAPRIAFGSVLPGQSGTSETRPCL